MEINRNLSEIRAEVLLNYLYPEMEERWTAHYDGSFYRNYSGDAMDIDEATGEVRLSRDGLLRLLPQGLLTRDRHASDDVRRETVEERRRLHLLHEAFLPFDTFAFQKRLAIERQVSELLDDKIAYLLKTYFDYDLVQETSPLVREAAVLLPFVSSYRGDLGFVANLLSTLTGCEVAMHTGRYSPTDTTRSWLPSVRYDICRSGLTATEYHAYREQLQPLVSFVEEWLIPFDVHCEVNLLEPHAGQSLDDRMVLNYNSNIVKP